MSEDEEKVTNRTAEMTIKTVEDLISRFPPVAQNIFNNLNVEDLKKCREVSKSFYVSLENSRLYWEKILKKFDQNQIDYKEAWESVVENNPKEKIKELATAVARFYTFRPKRLKFQHAPLHIVGERGNIALYRYISQKTGLVNPKRSDGLTPLHFARLYILDWILDKCIPTLDRHDLSLTIAIL